MWSSVVQRQAYRATLIGVVVAGNQGCLNVPDVRPAPRPIPQLDAQESRIALSVQLPLAEATAAINSEIPTSDAAAPYTVNVNGGPSNCQVGAGFGYSVSRSPIELSWTSGAISARTQISYGVAARARRCFLGINPLVDGSCGMNGESPRRATLSYAIRLSVDDQWQLSPQSVASITPIDRCKVTLFGIDVTDRVMAGVSAALGGATARVDAAIRSKADLHARIGAAWTALQEPYAIAALPHSGDSAFLVVAPISAGITDLSGSASAIHARAGIAARPQVIVGSRPATHAIPLPQNAPVSDADGFALTVPIEAEYAALANQGRALLRITEGGVRYPATGGKHVRPTGLDFYANGDQIVVRIPFKGSAKGVLYLAGTPTVNAATGMMTLPDLDYTIETRNLLVKVIDSWKRDALRDDLRARLQFDLSSVLSEAQHTATAALNRSVGPLQLTGTVNSLRLLGFSPASAPGRIRATVSAEGSLAATLTP